MKRFLTGLIRGYQTYISPMLRPCCRFQPTCSQYAIEAIQKHGALCGTILAILRVLRCNPLFRGGFDPVPEELPWRKKRGSQKPPQQAD